jgi:hypothetical protein
LFTRTPFILSHSTYYMEWTYFIKCIIYYPVSNELACLSGLLLSAHNTFPLSLAYLHIYTERCDNWSLLWVCPIIIGVKDIAMQCIQFSPLTLECLKDEGRNIDKNEDDHTYIIELENMYQPCWIYLRTFLQ